MKMRAGSVRNMQRKWNALIFKPTFTPPVYLKAVDCAVWLYLCWSDLWVWFDHADHYEKPHCAALPTSTLRGAFIGNEEKWQDPWMNRSARHEESERLRQNSTSGVSLLLIAHQSQNESVLDWKKMIAVILKCCTLFSYRFKRVFVCS